MATRVVKAAAWAAVGLLFWACSSDGSGDEQAGGAGGDAGAYEGGHGTALGGEAGVGHGIALGGEAGVGHGTVVGGAGGDEGLPALSDCNQAPLSGLSLATLCDQEVCPTLITPPGGPSYFEPFAACWVGDEGRSFLYGSTCGGFAIQLPYGTGRVTWHYDESHQLVGANITRTDSSGSVCPSESYGEACETSGDATELCSADGHCQAPLSDVEQLTETQVMCDHVCTQGPGVRVANDCGGVNLIGHRFMGLDVRIWSFDADGELVGFIGRGADFVRTCETGNWAIGVSYGSPCEGVDPEALDPDALGLARYGVCGAVGAEGGVSLEEAEACGVDCGHSELADYCGHLRPCPQPSVIGAGGAGGAGSFDYGIEAYCQVDTSTTVGDTSCGKVVDVRLGAEHTTWYFDEQGQLIGGEAVNTPSRFGTGLGTYCKTQSGGQVCPRQGTQLDICYQGGCSDSSLEAPTYASVTECPDAQLFEVDNDCGGVNVTSDHPWRHGSLRIWSFDADGAWLGTRAFYSEEGSVIHSCPEGGLGAGHAKGTLCEPVGDPRALCP